MTQRTATLDLGWERIFPDEYRAILPDIPDYTTGFDDNYVDIDGIGGSWMFTIWLDLVCGFDVCLYNKDFDVPYGSSFEEEKQFVENLSVEDIVRKVAEKGDDLIEADEFSDEELEPFHQLIWHNHYVTASRNTQRTATLDLDWERDTEYCRADLPAIPGYSGAAIATLTLKDTVDVENPWDIDIVYYPVDLAQDPVTVDCWSIQGFNPDTVSYWSLMNAVDELDVNAIGDALNNLGVEPEED